MARCLDLDKVSKKEKDFIQLGGKTKKYYFKELSIEEAKMVQAEMDDFIAGAFDMTSEEDAIDGIHELIKKMIDIPDSIVKDMTVDHFAAIVKFIQRKPFYDKGFTDKELDAMEKKAFKKKLLDDLSSK